MEEEEEAEEEEAALLQLANGTDLCLTLCKSVK